MSAVNTKHLSLLGKKVSFVSVLSSNGEVFRFDNLGIVSSVLFNLDGSYEFSLDTSDCFYSFDDVLEFEILEVQ